MLILKKLKLSFYKPLKIIFFLCIYICSYIDSLLLQTSKVKNNNKYRNLNNSITVLFLEY